MTETLPEGCRVFSTSQFDGVTIQIIEWPDLRGMTSPAGIAALAAAKASGMAFRQLRIVLDRQGAVTTEAGALQFWKGRIETTNRIPAGKILRRVFGSMMTGESVFRPTYTGVGEIWLEPTLQHYAILGLGEETVIVDQGCFHVCGPGVKVEAKLQPHLSSAALGGEGLFQTSLTGPGFCVLQTQVPESEIITLTLAPGERTVVDGPFALMRSSTIDFTVGKSSKSWFGTATSGEGLLNIFENRGNVPGTLWISPLEPIYESFGLLSATINAHAGQPTVRTNR